MASEWSEHEDTATGKTYYSNKLTKETTWQRPPALVKADWLELKDPDSGKTYYHNKFTNETCWQRPAILAKDDWAEHTDPKTNKAFYFNKLTQETTWDRPAVLARDDWAEYKDSATGKIYYSNKLTGETSWDRPVVLAREDWVKHTDPKTEKTFYVNQRTQETTWDKPSVLEKDEWVEYKDPATGQMYFCNKVTRETTWEKPAVLAKDDWSEHKDPASGKTYYCNRLTKQTCWERPAVLAKCDWVEYSDAATGKTWYYNKHTEETSWEKPAVLRNSDASEHTPAPQFPEKPAVPKEKPAVPKEAEKKQPSSQPEVQAAPAPQAVPVKSKEMLGLPTATPEHWSEANEMSSQGWSVIPVDNETLQCIKGLFVVTKPGELGRGRDAHEYSRAYKNLEVVCAWRLEHPTHWLKYAAERNAVNSNMAQLRRQKIELTSWKSKLEDASGSMPGSLFSQVGERYLLHGTSPQSVLDSLHQGFSDKLASLSDIFGAGSYFAEDPEKIDQYTQPDGGYKTTGLEELHEQLFAEEGNMHPGEDIFYCFVVRATCGAALVTEGLDHDRLKDVNTNKQVFLRSDRRQLCHIPGATPSISYHTLVVDVAKRKVPTSVLRFREIVLFEDTRVYPDWRLLGQLAAWGGEGSERCLDKLLDLGLKNSSEEAMAAMGLAICAAASDPLAPSGPAAAARAADLLQRLLVLAGEDEKAAAEEQPSGVEDGAESLAKKRELAAKKDTQQRCAVVWLSVLIRRLAQHRLILPSISEITAPLCRALARAVGGLSMFVADCALKSLCNLYRLLPSELRPEMLKGVFSSISNRTVVANMFVGTPDTQARKEEKDKKDSGGPNSWKIAAKELIDQVKDLMFLSRELQHPALFIGLLDQPCGSVWTGDIMREAVDLQASCLPDELQSEVCPQTLRPKLYVYLFHPNAPLRQTVVSVMANYFGCESPQAVSSKHPEEWQALSKHVVLSLGSERVASREAAVQAAQTLFRGRLWSEVSSIFEDVWTIVVKLMDDMEQQIQAVVKPLVRMMRNLTLRLCDVKAPSTVHYALQILKIQGHCFNLRSPGTEGASKHRTSWAFKAPVATAMDVKLGLLAFLGLLSALLLPALFKADFEAADHDYVRLDPCKEATLKNYKFSCAKISDESRELFSKEGVVVLREVFDPEVIEELAAEVKCRMRPKTTAEDWALSAENVWMDSEVFAQLVLHKDSPLGCLAAQLIPNASTIRYAHETVTLLQEGQNGSTGWSTDAIPSNLRDEDPEDVPLIRFFLPLGPQNLSNITGGSLKIIPLSAYTKLRNFFPPCFEGRADEEMKATGELKGDCMVAHQLAFAPQLAMGDILLYSPLIPHVTQQMLTGSRLAMQGSLYEPDLLVPWVRDMPPPKSGTRCLLGSPGATVSPQHQLAERRYPGHQRGAHSMLSTSVSSPGGERSSHPVLQWAVEPNGAVWSQISLDPLFLPSGQGLHGAHAYSVGLVA
eukprot:s1689_g2.t4